MNSLTNETNDTNQQTAAGSITNYDEQLKKYGIEYTWVNPHHDDNPFYTLTEEHRDHITANLCKIKYFLVSLFKVKKGVLYYKKAVWDSSNNPYYKLPFPTKNQQGAVRSRTLINMDYLGKKHHKFFMILHRHIRIWLAKSENICRLHNLRNKVVITIPIEYIYENSDYLETFTFEFLVDGSIDKLKPINYLGSTSSSNFPSDIDEECKRCEECEAAKLDSHLCIDAWRLSNEYY